MMCHRLYPCPLLPNRIWDPLLCIRGDRMDSRRSFLEKSATLAALGFLPRQISPEEWLEERERSRRAAPTHFKGKPCVISAANGYTEHPMGIKLADAKIDRKSHSL